MPSTRCPPPRSVPRLGLAEGAFVYCCFNQLYKIERRSFPWTRILHEVPAALLWLLGKQPLREARLRSGFEAAGIGPGRVLFAPNAPRKEHLHACGRPGCSWIRTTSMRILRPATRCAQACRC